MTDETLPVTDSDQVADIEESAVVETAVDAPDAPPQYGVWPFSIREIVLLGIWAIAFVFSFFSLSYFGFASVWTFGLSWVLTIGLPTVAVFLLVLRRLSPQGIRRVGSLGIDQFASVAFSVSALVWLQMVWEGLVFRPALHTWVHWAELLLMLAGVVFTVIAPFIPGIRDDFEYRDETVAHPTARPLRPIVPRPAPVAVAPAPPVAVYPVADTGAVYAPADAAPYAPAETGNPYASAETGNSYASAETGDPYAPVETGNPYVPAETGNPYAGFEPTTPDAEPASATETDVIDETVIIEPRQQQAFWALVPEERDVLDETGVPIFRIDQTAWALVIEDRGEAFVVRHEDGRIGYLHDVTGVTRG